MNQNFLANDLNYILENTESIWRELNNQRIFLTGGTGLFGTWLLETFAWANKNLALNLSVVILTRDKNNFAKKAPHLVNNPMFEFIMGDVRDYAFPSGHFSHVIHAATEASAKLNLENPQLMLETVLQGTRHTLDCAAAIKAKKFLFVSSGAVYGKQPSTIECVAEDYSGKPDSASAYALGKSAAEQECLLHAKQNQYEMKIARCFAFVGPHLPLDTHFAIGNFIRDGLLGKPLHVNGDGTPYRSYLYMADLVIWLLHILCHGESGDVYNVGSDESISIAELANRVASCFNPRPAVNIATIADPQKLPERYVPSVQKVKTNLHLSEGIPLTDAILKTIAWYQATIYNSMKR
jgi:nucleoside-diphosphate-sugar epimerase